MIVRIAILTQSLAPEAELTAFRAGLSAGGVGAVASFTGLVRGGCEALEIEHFPGVSERMIARFAGELADRFALAGVLALHRVGRLAPGEPIVLVACAARHRQAAFAAVMALMDWLKTEAPFWKSELRAGARVWIEPPPPPA